MPNGSIDCQIAWPSPILTSLCLGAKDRKTLLVTTGRILMARATLAAHPLSGRLFAISVVHPGQPPLQFG